MFQAILGAHYEKLFAIKMKANKYIKTHKNIKIHKPTHPSPQFKRNFKKDRLHVPIHSITTNMLLTPNQNCFFQARTCHYTKLSHLYSVSAVI